MTKGDNQNNIILHKYEHRFTYDLKGILMTPR